MDPVAGETLDGAGGRACADSPVMHNPTVTDMTVLTRAQRVICPARRLA